MLYISGGAVLFVIFRDLSREAALSNLHDKTEFTRYYKSVKTFYFLANVNQILFSNRLSSIGAYSRIRHQLCFYKIIACRPKY